MSSRVDFENWYASERPDMRLPFERTVSNERYTSLETEWAWRAWERQKSNIEEQARKARGTAPTDSGIPELDDLCASYNAGDIGITELICSAWNKALVADDAIARREALEEAVDEVEYYGNTETVNAIRALMDSDTRRDGE